MSAMMEVEVTAVRQLTPVVREFTLEAREGRLPAFSSGSHVQVVLPLPGRTLRNAYSLLGEPVVRQPGAAPRYRIAVRLQDDSRGGSRYMHEQVVVGQRLQIGVPSNLFPLHSQAHHHVLVAGGIGITPFMAYIAELEARGASFELHYAFRRGLTDVFLPELRERLGSRLHAYDAAAGQRLDCAELLTTQPLGSHLYVCGPQRLLDDLKVKAQALGWSAGRLHWEAFASPEPGLPFTVELASNGQRIEVPGDYSLLEALEGAGVAVPNLCRGGVCGQCATRYLSGEVEHRDHYLNAAQRTDTLMPCVSRGGCASALQLDL